MSEDYEEKTSTQLYETVIEKHQAGISMSLSFPWSSS